MSLYPSLFATAALAQAADPAAAGNTDQIQDIVVTAQKQARAESLQKVPIAITAVNINAINQAKITNIIDVGRLAPNVQLQGVGVYQGFANFTIRGIGVNGSLQSLDPGVTISFDGMPYGFSTGAIVDTFDVESIEIMRGPQGVLFGRNATGGAVALRTRRPKDRFGFEFSARLGNAGRLDQTAAIEGPLTDNLRAKIAVLHRKSDGLFNDDNGGTMVPSTLNPSGVDTSRKVNQVGDNTWMVRPILVFEPTDNFDVSLVGEYINGDSGGTDARILLPSTQLTSPTGYGYTPPPFGNEINHDADEFTKFKAYRAVLEANWHLGAGVVTSVTGYRKADNNVSIDADGTPFQLQNLPGLEHDKQLSQELRFASDFSDDFRFVVGGYYSDTDQNVDTRRVVANTTTNVISYQRGISFQNSKTAAIFGNFDLTAIDGLTLSAGARYTYEKKELDENIRGPNCTGGATFTGCGETNFNHREKSWRDVSPRFAANYQFNKDVMAYVSWTKGFRSGSFNTRANAAAGLGPSDPETAAALEAGFKSTLWDGKGRLNVTAFRTNYDDIIRVLTVGFVQDILNAAKATINGVEVEAEARPGGGFGFTAAIGWTDASFDQFDLNQDGVTSPAEKALKFDRVPEWTVTVGSTYDFNIPSVGDFGVRVGYSWRSSTYVDVQNTESLKLGSYGLLDASLSYKPNENWQVLLYGRNLADKNYYDFGARFATATFNVGNVVYGGTPRSYGVEVSYKF